MALSDQLSKLAARAKEAEDHAAAAQDKASADLEADVEAARGSAQAQAQALGETADATQGKVSDWWNDVQKNWNDHVAQARENIGRRKAQMDLTAAQRDADDAEADASFAINYAYGATEEAEYAVLDAALARKQADELAASA
ncbi:MAG: hypothetical protein JWR63_314 [Conexibacter sp.]|nr:hypothetical protein [Conexibacter sp.]